ncbi:zinc finger protein 329-like [Clarias gariepinus]|uniref:zinc finger protein 329-like n=1 Tax=Clarias gariepinus TaxID=13013 RepID=UPI00234D4BAB|nr:zinc finger protein 329-like [Clarias gariepinus]
MVDSHFHVQLTAVLDVLMKTAVSDICALAESWFKSLHMEIARSKKENEDLRQKLQSMEEQEQHQAAANGELQRNTTKEEKQETGSEVRGADGQWGSQSGCTAFAGTSTGDLAANAQLGSPSSEEDSLKRNCSAKESAARKRAHSRWNHTSVGTKPEMMNRSGIERLEQRIEDAKIYSQHYSPSGELKTESRTSRPALQSFKCSSEDGSHHGNEIEEKDDCVVLDDICEPESPQLVREEEQEFDVSCIWTPDLEQNSTHGLRDNQSDFTNSDCRMTLNLSKDLNLELPARNAQHFDYSKRTSVSLSFEKGNTFTCNICRKNLSTKNSLASHYRLHTGEKPFMCAQCGKSFAKKFNLDVHYNIHTGAKPYTCTLCPKSFADPSAFRRHEWIHKRETQQSSWNTKYKFSCNTCGKCFLSKPSLAAHSQLHHAEKRHNVQNVLFKL